MRRYTKIGLITLLTVVLRIVAANAQVPSFTDTNAGQTRDQLSALMNQYPPTLLRVLQTDPSLLQNKEYLALYPGLATFVAKHPEILHNANYFFGTPPGARGGPAVYERNNAFEISRQLGEDVAIMVVLLTVIGGITWIIRSVIEYRRWARTLKTQTDIHSRLMDRMTSSEDLLAYVQSPAGKRLLEFGPVAEGTAATGPTLNRILWSVQAGLVLGLAGIGLSYASEHVYYQVAQPFFVLGALGIAVGSGFILSAFASYIIARNMGLVRGTSETPPT